ncbi:hypothetical protein [Aquibacillus rhizosphaerae]|uniref:Pre-toxin TG domain-containing protein n=1 Tax=Aquibacillus rhizosphaerae TaxID=3051431 RepID=A0ABT7L8C9_9BACI|nr:hypothetical protein [Aquibacillus sp. LR5S19]MDL4842130.1 hypothetical protein [Aquibacillus sp. LR5S19]
MAKGYIQAVKVSNTASNALDAYKSAKTFDNIGKAELGIYGLASSNGFSEYITGKDILGNELTEEQRAASLGISLAALLPVAPTLTSNTFTISKQTIAKSQQMVQESREVSRATLQDMLDSLQPYRMDPALGTVGGPMNVVNPRLLRQKVEDTYSLFAKGIDNGYRYCNKTTQFKNVKVYQRDDNINPNMKDARGRTNLERMQNSQ